jgi:hypothetical protein
MFNIIMAALAALFLILYLARRRARMRDLDSDKN